MKVGLADSVSARARAMDGLSDLLQAAVGHLNSGDLLAAEQCLNSVQRIDPTSPQAVYLSGVVQFERQQWNWAESLFRRALAADPRQPQVVFHLSQTLRAMGRAPDALNLAAGAVKVFPEHMGLWLEVAKAQEETGDPDAAIDTCRQWLARRVDDMPAVVLLARLLAKTGYGTEAEQILRAALGRIAQESGTREDRAEALRELAAIVKHGGYHREALDHLDSALTLWPDLRGAQFDRSCVLQHLRRFDEATSALQAELGLNPINLDAHLQLNELLYRQGRDDEFLKSYDVALKHAPEATALLGAKAKWLLKVGKASEALETYQRALRAGSTDPDTLSGVQRALEAVGDRRRAFDQLVNNLKHHPQHAGTLVDGAGLLLRNGDVSQAEALARHAHALEPTDQAALAVLGLCFRQLNRADEFDLNGYETLIQVFDLDPPPGYATVSGFNSELAAYLGTLHGDQREYFTQTARGGTRVFDEVFNNGHMLIDRLKLRIDESVARYVGALSGQPSHPFIRRRTSTFAYSGSWSSTLRDRGFHVNHIHAAGWISSAYYVAVPDSVNDDAARQGWLKFGEPSAEFGRSFTPRRMVKPASGRLVLFPSYLWHGTTPFHSAQTRTTLAFDVVPISRPGH